MRPVTRRPLEALRRNDDPENSHVAVEQWYPTGGTCLDRCLDLLVHRHGEWVDASEFVDPAVGGLNATRRLRELREADPNVETRLKPGSKTIWQWRYRSARGVPAPRHTAPDAKSLKRFEPKPRRRGASSVQRVETPARPQLSPEEKEARRQARLERDLEQARGSAARG